jgi:ATP-binding cassette, subfamily B, bacterial PglK
MRKYIREIIYLIGDDKKKLPAMILLFLWLSILDLIGVGLIGPYATLVIDSGASDGILATVIETIGLPREKESLLIMMGFILVGIFFLKTVSAVWVNNKIIRFSLSQQVRLRSFLMQSYQNMPYIDFLQRNSSEYILSIQQYTQQYSNQVLMPLLRILSDAIVALVILGLLAWHNGPALVLLLGLLGVIIWGYDRFFRRKVYVYGKNANIANVSMLQGVREGIDGLKEIRILGCERYFHQNVQSGATDYSNYNGRSQVIGVVPRYLLELLMISFIVLLVIGTLFLEKDLQLLIPTLGMFAVASLRLLPSANQLSSSLIQVRSSRNAISHLYTDMRGFEQTEILSPVIRSELTCDIFRNLKLDNVFYRFPGASVSALNDVSMEIQDGESIGVIGSSGSGKTTLLDTILGLLVPQKGVISYNGVRMDDSLLTLWRSQVAYIQQKVFLVDDTLRNNVALGVNSDKIDDENLNEALHNARLTDLVKKLPLGVHTMLGEQGVRLSGGQRQRVALARAFYHGRKVLVMDEATSALDHETEREIVDEIKRLKGKKTMIVIAHRMTTLEHCDRVYRFDNGKIVQIGTYNTVIANENKGYK